MRCSIKNVRRGNRLFTSVNFFLQVVVHLLVLVVLEPALVVEVPDLVLAGPEDGHVVVDDGIFGAWTTFLKSF